MKAGIIILAAGESKRMGIPKQLLNVHGKSMLKRIIDAALETECYPITVVVGAHKKHVVPELAGIPINITDNPNWKTGMAGSIKMGLVGTYLISKEIDAVIITTADMPLVSSDVFNRLLSKARETDLEIVISDYGHGRGVPALIKRPLFEDLLNLQGDEGARQIFSLHKDKITSVSFLGGAVDIDTKEDYHDFLHSVN